MPTTQHPTTHAADSAAHQQQQSQVATFFTRGHITRTWGGKSPYQVLGQLPPTATEGQRDSIIRAHFRPGKTKYNTKIDTLDVFGVHTRIEKKLTEMDYRDLNFNYSGDSVYHAGIYMGQNGVLGDPVPYAVSNDNTITGLLVGCFILAMISFANSRNFILRQVKSFFYVPRSVADLTETTSEVRFQLFLIAQTSLLLAIIYYFYSRAKLPGDYVIESQLQVISLFFAISLAYFLLKGITYQIVNWTFFDKKKCGQWSKTFLFLSAAEGVLLFPVGLLQVYASLPLNTALICALIIIILVKILTFYKSYSIFFKRFGVFLQFILYFCALEMIPMIALWGVLTVTGNYLKINF